MILLDSNVLMYAVGGDHALKPVAAVLVSFGYLGRFRVTPRVLEEFAFVYARRGRARSEAVELVGAWASSFAPVEHLSEEDLAAGFDLWSVHPRLDLADALLAASALRHEAQLVSADVGFGSVPALRFVNLASLDLRAELDLPGS